ncbi:phenylalanine--tRNA ligase subunit beta [Candidatus Profftia sp. (ex Adelges kitamiensis)]|uniref:phenylalanine--tRNA ligase subunit beta n=1 Tax=Candidatus Profftia sp. (ex Adelges kitamiensis) TaxID=2864218 RepID=UPI001CE31D41|nr:phenylalanine--tRNA ligase subunit beta [Candidatus Profftia sp. (ex Adelges kitamiensis)]
MKFSELWLREWVNPAISSEVLLEQITMAGLEVDSIKSVASEFYGVFVGKVILCNHHPNIDKIWITKVDIGKDKILDIVCEAPNCRKDLKVAVATIGSTLSNGDRIKNIQIHGVLSQGILCSFTHLGISENDNGIIELPMDAPIGINIREYLQLHDNTIEINVTPNRADCLSIIGIARDVAIHNNMSLNEPLIKVVPTTINDTLPVKVEAIEACPRYLSRVVKNINLTSSTPLWMREKLRRSGIRSINPIIDVTNYVLIELGQPIHAFDLNLIKGGIVIRMAKQENEKIILLNGNEVTLSADTLVIADQEKILAMGGIMGGAYSCINMVTNDVLLECAYFNPSYIIGRARRQCLHTDASHRYERGVDPYIQAKAMERATSLLINICGGQAGPVIEITNEVMLPKYPTIILRRAKLDRLIGYHIVDDQVTDILKRLGCKVIFTKDTWQVVAPSWSFDIKIEENIISKVARVYGYHNIPDVPIKVELMMTKNNEDNLPLQRVKTMLADRGYQEVITYSFVDPKIQNLLHPSEESLSILSPISPEMSAMRVSLWTGLLSVVVHNQHRQESRVRLFETGLRFIPNTTANLGVRQEAMLACVITGNQYKEHWNFENKIVDFYDLKGDLESILDLTCNMNEFQFKAKTHPALHPGKSAAIYLSGILVGFIGVVHPALERKLDLNGRTVIFEIELQAIAKRRIPKSLHISRYPPNRRDISIVIDENIPAEDVLLECRRVGINQLVDVNLFDVYHGETVIDGYKSLAISLIFQDTTHTLKEQEITAAVAKCVQVLKYRFKASLRD